MAAAHVRDSSGVHVARSQAALLGDGDVSDWVGKGDRGEGLPDQRVATALPLRSKCSSTSHVERLRLILISTAPLKIVRERKE